MSDHSALKRLADEAIIFSGINGETSYAQELFAQAASPEAALALIAEVTGLHAQHGRDSAELRNLCQERDDARKERDQLKAEVESLRNPVSKKTDCGHGHVYPSLSGYKARCGGPGLCAMCSRDAATKAMGMESQRVVPVIRECAQGYGHGGQWCGPGFDCWLDPRSKAERNGHGMGCVCSVCTQ